MHPFNRPHVYPHLFDFSYLITRSTRKIFLKFLDSTGNKPGMKVLDVGCGYKPWEMFFNKEVEYIGVDHDAKISSADYEAPADRLPFGEGEFDALVYTWVLEHVDNLPGAVAEMRRVAKKGAFAFITVPFLFPEHGIPDDYQRMTEFYFRKIFRDEEILFLQPSNSSFSTPFGLMNMIIEGTTLRHLWGIKHLFYILMNGCGVLLDWLMVGLTRYVPHFKRHRKSLYLAPFGYYLIVKFS